MKLDYEIIVSYSSSDNFSGKAGKGWVWQFCQYLKCTLSRIMGSEPEILLHSEEETINVSHYNQNTFIIMILTPEYLKSGLFEREINGISNLGINVKDASARIIKVLKSPLDEIKIPELIRHLLPYRFYIKDIKKHHNVQQEWHSDLSLKMLDLVYDLQLKVEEKRGDIFGLKLNTKTQKRKVYLAYTGNDLQTHREIVHRELVRQQIEVRPLSSLPTDMVDLEYVIKKEMEECELSIHLIGEDYGDIPKGTDKSIVDIQNKIAVEISSNPFRDKISGSKIFSRYVWISPDLKKVNEKQKIFIENIKRDSKALKEDEILQVPFDELKEIIQNKVISHFNINAGSALKSSYSNKGKGTVYLINEKVDQQISNGLAAYLEVEGYDVIYSDFNGDLLSVRKRHQECLNTCDASIIVCGEVNYEWINIKLQDLIKAPGFGRTKPFKAKALFVKNEKYLHFQNKLVNLDDSIILESSAKLIPENFFLFLNKITA